MTEQTATLTVADLYSQPPLMPLWPTFGCGVCQLAESTTYQLAAQGRLPVEAIQLGRRKFVRTADVLAWLHLPTNGSGAEVAPLMPLPEGQAPTAASPIVAGEPDVPAHRSA